MKQVWTHDHPQYDKHNPDRFPPDLIVDVTARKIWIDIVDQMTKIRADEGENDDLLTHYRVCLKMIVKNVQAFIDPTGGTL